ncbi:DMT family transporter [Sansalvadorimonas sp. 2012CJ34-2]|uniref:DMT family transporter n=1 Tax=Parendozoicomonas callyspongiae TaxID=2942213 RepID=A0ABT0PEM2_9GAMM|nr:DMT family transporter [Sansalvadorimonas sp. 2012CJ34-2]MCL6269227.1 DMT family transporter [Sansalvadorimonas sp. 2012CJ34-2]
MKDKNPVYLAIIFLVVGNQFGIMSDALIKSLGFEGPLIQLLFYRQLMSTIILFPVWLKYATPSSHMGIHVLRANLGTSASLCMFFALNTLPLATTHAIYYSLPLFTLPMAFLLLGTKATRAQCIATAIGFIGVLIIIRPTSINWGAVSAFACALATAFNVVIVRKLPENESVIGTLFWMNALALPVSFGLYISEDVAWNMELLMWAGLSAILVMFFFGGSIAAYKMADAGNICGAEYTGLVGSAAVGFFIFSELPDIYTIIGATLIIVPLIYIGKKKSGGTRQLSESY